MYASERGQSTVRNSVVDRVSEQRTPPRELGEGRAQWNPEAKEHEFLFLSVFSHA